MRERPCPSPLQGLIHPLAQLLQPRGIHRSAHGIRQRPVPPVDAAGEELALALLAALDEGRIGQATLDVFRVEPLPPDHPYWAHPRISMTPHIAAITLYEESTVQIAKKIARIEQGQPVEGLVDLVRGY